MIVPDPFGTLELSDAPGKHLPTQIHSAILSIAFRSKALSSSLILHYLSEKLIEGLKSPDTSSLMIPDLLSLSDPFSGSMEESVKGVCVIQSMFEGTAGCIL